MPPLVPRPLLLALHPLLPVLLRLPLLLLPLLRPPRSNRLARN
jgi:hypothetical protein